MASIESNTQTFKMTSFDSDINQHFQDAIDVIQQHSDNPYYDSDYTYYESLASQQQCQISCCLITHPPDVPTTVCEWSDMAQQPWPQVMPDVPLSHTALSESPHFISVLPPPRSSKGRKKLRLYEYLHEALNNPNMGDSIQWTDSGCGTFHFISKNKEKLAESWGQRKGNRKTMTYQKMARALRNYSRTGEIRKVRRKLTYQFSSDILHKLGTAPAPSCHTVAPEEAHGRSQMQAEQNYCGTAALDWHGWYGHYQLQDESDVTSGFTSHSMTKL
ncbi:transcription factor Spi-C isoform X1 [Nelusetta ayraudi]|uniref:transcription factor Spi-C isoform X1 n=1 Tax=Nelusetta ayraudi TaxID=303726 RepID=UPI003F71796B